MRALSASNLLDIWERGAGSAPVDQALAILSAAFPQASKDALATIDFVQRDLCLLHLRTLTFGSQIKGLADCPACGQRLELDFDARELPAWTYPVPDPAAMKSLNPETSLQVNDYEVIVRLPNSKDLATLSHVTDAATRRQQLIEACVISAQRNGEALMADELPPDALNLLAERISQDHPLAEQTLAVVCPACGHAWDILFDIVSLFWSEIHAWSLRLMREVHILASAYGWREADILAMSAWRRQRYLEMVGVR
jgi:hypothetical protein